MPVETATYVSELSVSDPPGTDFRKQGDDHLRLIKTVLKASFPNASKPFYIPDYVAKTTTYAALASDQNRIIGCSTAAGAWTLTLPSLSAGLAGWSTTIIKTEAAANDLTIVPASGTINGAASLVIDTQYEFVEVMWTGTTWLAKSIATNYQPLDSDLTALAAFGNWKVMYTNGSGVPTALALGASGEVLTSGGASSAPSFVAPASGVVTGVVMDYVGTTAPSGWLLLFGDTIGNAASGGTARANADTEALFTLLWNSMANTEAAVSGGRGASAAADYAANKTIALPDARGRVIAGQDDMGGSSANRLTGVTGSVNGDTLGGTGGTETHTLTTAELAAHTHALAWTSGKPTSGTGSRSNDVEEEPGSKNTGSTTNVGNMTITSAGGDGAHNNVQPTLILNKIIKL